MLIPADPDPQPCVHCTVYRMEALSVLGCCEVSRLGYYSSMCCQALVHGGSQQEVLIRTTDLLSHLDISDEESSELEESSEEVSTDSEMSDFDKNFYDDDIDELENIENQPGVEECGFSGHALFR